MAKYSSEETEKLLTQQLALVLGISVDGIDVNAPLHELGVDSLSLVELFVFIEKTFELKLMESGITQEDLKTIKALAARISE